MLWRVAFLSGFILLHLNFSGLHAQTDTISLEFTKVPLGEVLFLIEKKSEYRFFYSNDKVNLDKTVTGKFTAIPFNELLENLFRGSRIEYRTAGKQILLVPSRKLILRFHEEGESEINELKLPENGIPVAGRFGNEIRLQGRVFDVNTELPLPGVNIIIQKTGKGTASDAEGNFQLVTDNKEQEITISSIGYLMRKIRARGNEFLEIGLEPDLLPLEEVVVIGYGELRKGDLTGAISTIDGIELNNLPVAGVDLALHGKASGVYVTSSSGRPGAPVSVKIRGIGTVNNSEPLYVIDGIPFVNEVAPWVDNNPLNAINPNDIESVEILKDASATAIYGSRGANGIIMVNTRRGKTAGKTKIGFSSYQGVTSLQKKLDILDNNGYLRFLDSMYIHGGPDPVMLPAAYSKLENIKRNNDWQDLVTRKGRLQNYHLNFSGGGIHHNFYIASGYFNQEGIMRGTGYQRLTLTANADFQLKRFRLGESLHISQLSQQLENNTLGAALESAPIMPVYDPLNRGGFAGPSEKTTGNNNSTNVLAENLLREKHNRISRIFGGIYAAYDFTPWLTFQTNLSGDFSMNYSHEFGPVYDLGSDGEASIRGNSVSKLYQNSVRKPVWLIENLFKISKTFTDHQFNLVLGHSAQSYYSRGLSASATNVSSPDEVIINSDRDGVMIEEDVQEWRLLSYLGRANYAFKERYLFTTSLRMDGSSRFSETNLFAWFPSFSAGWKISEEPFYSLPIINFMKIRGGWGISGNQEIGNYGYASEITSTRSFYVFGPGQVTYFGGTPLQQYGNKEIHWESNIQSDAGIDLGLFDNKIMITADYYYRLTSGMLVKVPLSGLSGYLQGFAEPYLNVGKIMNQGVEFSVSFRNSWNRASLLINANFATIKNKVIDLGGNIITGGDNGETITMEGYPLGSFYGYVSEGIFQTRDEIRSHAVQTADSLDTQPGDIRFNDVYKDGSITPEDRTVIGKSIPDFIYGGSIDFSYGPFDINITLQGVKGADIYNETRRRLQSPSNLPYCIDRNKMSDVFDYWRPGNTSTSISRLVRDDMNQNDRISDRWIDDGSYLRIKHLELGYSFQKKILQKLYTHDLRIYVALENFFTFTRYPGYDPEFGPISPTGYGGEALQLNNIDTSKYPQYKTFLMGFHIHF
ncbi:MAG: TonB-dependent receptor [Bacteroidales bacterium]